MIRRQRIPPTDVDFDWMWFLFGLHNAMVPQRRIVLTLRAARRNLR